MIKIVRSATSIGANIHETNYAASKADFINKILNDKNEVINYIEKFISE